MSVCEVKVVIEDKSSRISIAVREKFVNIYLNRRAYIIDSVCDIQKQNRSFDIPLYLARVLCKINKKKYIYKSPTFFSMIDNNYCAIEFASGLWILSPSRV